MKLKVVTTILFATLLLVPAGASAKQAVKNGSFEKNKQWECTGCDTLGVNTKWLFGKNDAAPHGKRAAYIVPNVTISQTVKVPRKNPAVGLSFKYQNTGSFQVVVADKETGEEYVNEIVDSFASEFVKKSYTLPGRVRGRKVDIRVSGLQYTSYIDRVRLVKLSYPVARFQVLDKNGDPLKYAKIWFERNGKTKDFKQGGSKVRVRNHKLNKNGKSGAVRVLAPPKKTKLCAKKNKTKQCVSLYDVNSFDYGTDGSAVIILEKFD